MQLELSTIVTFNPLAIAGETTLGEIVEMLDSLDFHQWPVVDSDRRLIGLVTNDDLVRVFEAGAAAIEFSTSDRGEQMKSIRNQPVHEVMSPRVLSIQKSDSPAAALWTLLEHQIHALPVLTDDYLTDLATTSDFLREFSYGGSRAACVAVSETMQPPCDAVDCDATLDDVATAMHLAQSDAIPVVRGDLPLGVVSRRDLRRLKLRQTLRDVFDEVILEGDASTILALAASAPTIRPGERLSSAARLMIEHRRPAIAVVNQAGRLLGVVTEEMVLRAMLAEIRSSRRVYS